MIPDVPIGRGPPGNVGRMVAHGGAWMVGARLARTLVTVIGMIFLARLLTPDEFGIIAIATSVSLLGLVILEGAIDFPIVRHDGLTRDGVRSLIWAGLLGMAASGAIIWAVAPAIDRLVDFPILTEALRLTVPVLILQVYAIAGGALLRRQHRFRAAGMLSVVSTAAYVIPAVALAFMGFGVWSALAAQIFAAALTALLLARYASIGLGLPSRFTLAGTGGVGGYGALSRILGWAWTAVPTYAVALLLGPTATGFYSRAYNINTQMKEPFAALDQALRQAFAGMKGDGDRLAGHSVTGLRLITILSGLTAAAVIILREVVVLVLLGNQWLAVAPVIAILSASFPARIARLYFDSLSAAGGSMANLIFRQAFLLVAITLGLALFANNGIEHVALVVSGAVWMSIALPQSRADADRFGGLPSLLASMLPGLALAAAIIAIDHFAIRPLTEPSMVLRTMAQLGLLAIAAVPVLLLPTQWLPGSWAAMRARAFSRLGVRYGNAERGPGG